MPKDTPILFSLKGSRYFYLPFFGAVSNLLFYRLSSVLLLLKLATSPLLLFGQVLNLRHFSVEHGLSSTTVYDMVQDSAGFIWLGTESGLSRFDGSVFQTFTTDDGLPGNTVINVDLDRDGRLWLSCYNGGVSYYHQGKFYTSKNHPTLAKMEFRSGFYDFTVIENALLFYDASKVYRVELENSDSDTAMHVSEIGPLPPSMRVVNVMHHVTYGMGPDGIFKLAPDNLQLAYPFDERELNACYEANDHSMFQGIHKKVYAYSCDASGKFHKTLVHAFDHPIEVLRVMDNNTLWVQIGSKELFRIRKTGAQYGPPEYFPGITNINYAFADREQNLWFSTANNGVYMLQSEDNFLIFGKNNGHSRKIMSLEQGVNGGVLAGDVQGALYGIHQLVPKQFAAMRVKRAFNRIIDLVADSKTGKTWIGTDEGLFVLNRGQTKPRQILYISVKNLSLSDSHLLAAFSNGVQVFDRFTEKNLARPFHLRTHAMLELPSGDLWLGRLNGITILRKAEEILLEKRFPVLKNIRVIDFVLDRQNRIWVATHQNGVLVMQGDTAIVRHLTKNDGLTSNICQNITIDPDGSMWICTNAGLCKVSPETWTITKYSAHDVLPDNDVYDVLVIGDTVWAATADGVTLFKNRSRNTDPAFHTRFMDMTTNGVHYDPDISHVFSTDSCDLYFRVAAISFKSGGQFRYAIRRISRLLPWHLLTFDNLWQFATTGNPELVAQKWDTLQGNQYRMSDISPGQYRYIVTGISYDGVVSGCPDTLNILIKPPIHRRIWIQVLVLSLLALVARHLYHWRMREKDRELKWAQETTNLKLEAFKSQINPHFIFNTINGIQRFFYPPDPASANIYISLFSGLLRKTIDFSEKTTISFQEELQFLIHYLEITQLRVGKKFEFTIYGAENIPGTLDMPTLLLQPLVENAVVHGFPASGNARLTLRFYIDSGRLVCQVDDNGIGIRASMRKKQQRQGSHTSKGNHLLHQRIVALNQLLRTDIQLAVYDKSELQPPDNGTLAELSFKLISPILKQQKDLHENTRDG